MPEFRLVKLGEIVDFLTGFPFKSADYTKESSGIRLLRGDNIVQGKIRWDGVKRLPKHLANQSKQYSLFPGDVVLAMDRPWIEAGLKYAALTEEDSPSLLVQRVTRLRGTKYIDKGFLRYVIGGRSFTDYVLAIQTGTAVPHISGGQIKSFQFLLPAMAHQQSIASVLSVLDDKIELNRRMNSTLEAMARGIFKDWFVDFGPTRAKMAGIKPYLEPETWKLFPDILDDQGIPQGWKLFSLDQIAHQCKGSVVPTNDSEQLFEHYSIPAFDSGQNPAADFGGTIMSNKTPVPEGSILLSKLNPEISRVWMPNAVSNIPQIASTEFLVFQPIGPASRGLLYFLFSNEHFKQLLEGMATGTSKSHQRITPSALLSSKVLVGSPAVMRAFENVTADILVKLLSNRANSRTISSIRDLLVPKLMSGDFSINDAAKVAA